MRSWAIVAAGLFVVGCAELRTTHVGPLNPHTHIPGIIHALPMTQFEIKIDRRIIDCSNGEVRIAVKAAATPHAVEDYEHTYVLDPSHLSQFMNTTSFDVKFHEGTNVLAAINADVDDQTGDTIRTLVSAIGDIGQLSPSRRLDMATLSFARADRGGEALEETCPARLQAALERARQAERALSNATRALNSKTTELTTAQNALKNASEDDQAELQSTVNRLKREVTEANRNVAAGSQTLQNALRTLVHSTILRWPERSNQVETDDPILDMSRAALRRMLRQCRDVAARGFDGFPACNDTDASSAGWADRVLSNDAESQLDVFFKLERTSEIRGSGDPSRSLTEQCRSAQDRITERSQGPTPADIARLARLCREAEDIRDNRLQNVDLRGVPYRVPLPGRLIVCQQQACGGDNSFVVASFPTTINQFGYVAYLPVSSGPFEDNEFGATFSPNGQLLTVSYNQTGSAGSSIADLLSGWVDDEQARREAEAEAILAELQNERDQISLLQEIAEAREAYLQLVAPDDGSAGRDDLAEAASLIQAETTLLEAQLARLQAQALLAAAQDSED